MAMKVSIIIPVYNSEKYVEECVESVISQSYMDLEIILVNDGSKDNSLSVLNELRKQDKRIKVLDQINKGASAARNTGIRYSSGDYIQFLDSDDKLSQNKIESQINLLKKYDFQQETMVFSQFQIIGNNLENHKISKFPIWHDYSLPKEILIDFVLSESWIQPACYLIPRYMVYNQGNKGGGGMSQY